MEVTVDERSNLNELVDQLKEKISRMIFSGSISRLESQIKNIQVECRDVPADFAHGKVLKNWMSIILVSGPSIRITLKAHYDKKDARSALSSTIVKNENITNTQLFDFVKEYSNLCAGILKKHFVSIDVPVGISLPLNTRGFYEAYFQPLRQNNTLYSVKELCFEQNSFYISCLIEILNPRELRPLINLKLDNHSDDEPEFL